MRLSKLNFEKSRWTNLYKLAAVILAGCVPGIVAAQQVGSKAFSSPEEACGALAAAAQSNDKKAMLEIFGPEGKEIVSSGDETEDAEMHANFAKKYQEMHRFVKEPDGNMMLYIGAENWPAPIPLVHKGDSWYFDTEAGKKEILFRRIGRNEVSTIRVCLALVAAQKEYFAQRQEYAQQIFSDEGQHNGLYWKAAENEPQSPIGPLVASAVAEGYVKGQAGPPTPYRGYLYHVMTRQGKNAPGGAMNYVAGGKMREGFAFVAYPAEYRSSGVMTFVVDADGVVYEKDLGPKTEAVGKSMKEFNPSDGWKKAEEQEEAASQQMR
jgi:hypothetical protein